MHPFVNVKNAVAGHLESPAFLRKILTPKVAIGSRWEPRKRETLDHRGGVYKGFNPAMDQDAHCVQQAILAPSLCEFTPKNPSKRKAKWVEAGWWMLAGVLISVLVFLCFAMANAPKF